MTKWRLDQLLTMRKTVSTRSQAESYIKMGKVLVDGNVITKPGHFINDNSKIELVADEQFVSRAALKLKSVSSKFNLNFSEKVVLDIGSSTGGFTEFALSRGAKKVIAVDVGTDQLHPKLRADKRVELHEKTDIRNFRLENLPDIILIDVSFISLREVLPYVAQCLSGLDTLTVAMMKPQFESGARVKNAGVIKNDTERRKIIKEFETWLKQYYIIKDKADSEVVGMHGNRERFYLLRNVN